MTKLNVQVVTDKCQGYGACAKVAPEVFSLDASKKAQVGNPSAAAEDLVLRAARSCPYRAVVVVDTETGEQLIPHVRAKH